MASSAQEAIPVKLPVPPSLPPKRHDDDSVAGRALAALADQDEPLSSSSSLDAEIRWTVDSGSIVQKGERIATIFYSYHSSTSPPASCINNGAASSSSAAGNNGGNGIIRARKGKRWGAATNASSRAAAGNTTTNKTQAASSNGGGASPAFVSLQIRSPSAGFLRTLYKKPFASNAVKIDDVSTNKCSVINLILAAVEPCEHPAVVGGLCAVCGEDLRAPKDREVISLIDDDDEEEEEEEDPIPHGGPSDNSKTISQNKGASYVDLTRKQQAAPVVDIKQQQIIDKQKKLAALMSKEKEFEEGNDDEMANFDMDAAIESAKGPANQSSSTDPATNPAPVPKVAPKPAAPVKPKIAKPAAKPMRSLSSLLSGAKATQNMQTVPSKQRQPPVSQNRQAMLSRVRQRQQMATASNQSSNTAAGDSKMSKVTVSGGVTITISETEAKNISDGQSKKLREEKKLCLVLDLDHTLLHATDDYRAGRFVAQEVRIDEEKKNGDEKDRDGKSGEGTSSEPKQVEGSKATKTKSNPDIRGDVRSILLPVELPPAQQQQYVQQKLQQQSQEGTNFCLSPLPQQGQSVGASSHIIMRHFIKLRPHLKEFLTKISSTYQLSVYTAGTRSYAEQVAVMICRHLVGATLDEEDLNLLRSKVREKEDECRRYRDYKAKLGRKKQLELLEKEGWGDKDDDGNAAGNGDVGNGKIKAKNGKPKKKGVSFGGGKSEPTGGDKANGGKATSNDGKSIGINAKSIISKKSVNADAEKKSSEAADNDAGERKVSSQKRSNASSNDRKMEIPRKKKKLTNSGTGSLLALLPIQTPETAKKKVEKSLPEEEKELADPSQERDRLRKELKEGEKLEIAAVELRRKIFGSRIVSRTDVGDLGKDVKSLKRVFPCGGVMAAILDDREDVWANAKNNVTGRPGEPPDNLLLVKPYHWKPFMGYADVNNASGGDLSENGDAQQQQNGKPNDKEDDMQLLWTADVLRRLHERYYSPSLTKEEREGLSVPSLLQAMRKETLLRYPRVKVVFSGLIPINRQNKQSQIRPHVVRYAEELGAEVLPSVSREVTHVVAARDGSEKIRQARKEVPSCYIVHTSWLMECFWSISRIDVRPHHMGPVPIQLHPKEQEQRATMASKKRKDAHSKEGDSTGKAVLLLESDEKDSDDDDDSEDDFAADLEKEMMNNS